MVNYYIAPQKLLPTQEYESKQNCSSKVNAIISDNGRFY